MNRQQRNRYNNDKKYSKSRNDRSANERRNNSDLFTDYCFDDGIERLGNQFEEYDPLDLSGSANNAAFDNSLL